MQKKILFAFGAVAIITAGIIYFILQKNNPASNSQAPTAGQNASGQTQTPETQPEPQSSENQAQALPAGGENDINTFEKCVAAGKKVIGEKPNRRCIVNDDLAYIEIETCTAPTGESMSIFDAQREFEKSQCSREGSPDKHYCNEGTGTWWIDIVAYRKGCSPACVIDVVTKKAEVNWRCTGAQP